jgi:hypothetical protein
MELDDRGVPVVQGPRRSPRNKPANKQAKKPDTPSEDSQAATSQANPTRSRKGASAAADTKEKRARKKAISKAKK